ncbi:MAG: type II toxin-antitoxin system RelE/ParE family toxin [Acidimicrobiia bacterium]
MGAKRRWRDYRTPGGRRPVKQFIDGLSDADAAAIVAAMKDVEVNGNEVAHHLDGDIYEVRAAGDKQAFRILYATEGKEDQVLLALESISKKTQRTPRQAIQLAKRRLADWRSRGRKQS